MGIRECSSALLFARRSGFGVAGCRSGEGVRATLPLCDGIEAADVGLERCTVGSSRL